MMKAAWDWYMPRTSSQDESRLVAFACELGFDTLVIRDPTSSLVQAGRENAIRIVAVLSPQPDENVVR